MRRNPQQKSQSQKASDFLQAEALREACKQLLSQCVSELLTMDTEQLQELVARGQQAKNPNGSGEASLSPQKTRVRQGTPEIAPKTRENIIASALSVFLDEGYGANLDFVAERAGVTKRTIYSHFSSKEKLFRAALDLLERQNSQKAIHHTSGDIFEELLNYARTYLEVVLDEKNIKGYRIVTVPIKDVPDAGIVGYETLKMFTNHLAKYFEMAINAGTIMNIDATLLAEQFLSTIVGQARSRALMGMKRLSKAKEEAYLKQAVGVFLRGILCEPTAWDVICTKLRNKRS